MRSRFLTELTTPEIEQYLLNGETTAILPVGCTEMHGPHQPVGTDTIAAKAFALKLAEKMGGIVLPEIPYSWAGSTDGFAGTISIEPEIIQKMVAAVVEKAFRTGFRRVIISSIHAPNKFILYATVRQIFEKQMKPVIFIDFFEPFDKFLSDIFSGGYESAKEASIILAALDILGRQGLYIESDMSYEDQPPARPDSLVNLRKIGVVGSFMQDPRQHACPSKYVSSSRGMEFIEKQVEYAAQSLNQLDDYELEIDKQNNKGWWKITP